MLALAATATFAVGLQLGFTATNCRAFEVFCACKHKYVTDATRTPVQAAESALIAVYFGRCFASFWHATAAASSPTRRNVLPRPAEGCVDANTPSAAARASGVKTLAKQASRGARFLATPVLLSGAESSHYLLSLIRSAVTA